MKAPAKALALLVSTNIGIGAANAAEQSIYLSPQALQPTGSATLDATLQLADVGQPAFYLSFVFPAGYAANTPVKVRIYFAQSTPPADCNVIVRVTQAFRRRHGKPTAASSFPNLDNVVVSGGEATTISSSGPNTVKTIVVRPPQGASFIGQRTGDHASLRIERIAGADDTCTGILHVHGVEVRYTVAP